MTGVLLYFVISWTILDIYNRQVRGGEKFHNTPDQHMADTHEAILSALRQEMIEQIALHARFVGDQTGKVSLDDRLMEVMGTVPRHEFVPPELRPFAYLDTPLPIGCGKTISQPFIVALMTDLLDVQPQDHILEVGTGLGYQAAVLANLAKMVYSIEIVEELAREADRRLRTQGYTNIELRVGDGSFGWPEHAPFDKVIVTAAPDLIPPSLLNQLKPGAKMVVPAGIENAQQLMFVEKDETGHIKIKEMLAVRFSPLITTH